ncbi:CBS domain-containing protein [Methanomassiliicoccus luminyensis]|jgi:CBS domain-containing protein|uniref:CBS domain-containing protein n=1 Tax=Methanomassiliicoccus luminyensis TaxID=1080712 RepID=UPI000367C098|nr:CBS domain-containing protein [Methanomassiliicoccus luminyensis]
MLNKKFSEATVGDVCDCVKDILSRVVMKDDIRHAIDRMLENPMSRTVYVMNDKGKYVGVLNAESILKYLVVQARVEKLGTMVSHRFLMEALAEEVEDIMVSARTVKQSDSLSHALAIMFEDHMDGLPVVDDSGLLVGELSCLELFKMGRNLLDDQKCDCKE